MWAPHGIANLPQPDKLLLLNTLSGTNTSAHTHVNSPSPSSLDDARSLVACAMLLFVVLPVCVCWDRCMCGRLSLS